MKWNLGEMNCSLKSEFELRHCKISKVNTVKPNCKQHKKASFSCKTYANGWSRPTRKSMPDRWMDKRIIKSQVMNVGTLVEFCYRDQMLYSVLYHASDLSLILKMTLRGLEIFTLFIQTLTFWIISMCVLTNLWQSCIEETYLKPGACNLKCWWRLLKLYKWSKPNFFGLGKKLRKSKLH